MIKNLSLVSFCSLVMSLVVSLFFSNISLADYATTPTPAPRPSYNDPRYPQPYPYPAPYPAPYPVPQPYPVPVPAPAPYPGAMVTCYAQGLANGAWFYGIATNVYGANQYALGACQATGQYCRLTGCQ